ncbi:2-iminoacetate synthase [Desulfobaculum xiamenense]|uniref:2-iminoacetate synthase n=1 Tax=Desulfobaculum xiamenense TaxID=995050 RepID=A0A846QU37_9BACT|nr:[FeFe] hydrogenase H-cluster radical SAM maturase HydG [Desulfobaculum xiamenense]NJB68159.1 2-iminoacetate synthase [Desulfobaculum xiamenense]
MKIDTTDARDFIDESAIWSTIERTENPDPSLVRETLAKARERKGLTQFDTAVLLQNKDLELDEEIFSTAREVKKGIYGNRLVLFAPLYVTNECMNRCAYCGFKADNSDLDRRTLTDEELSSEVRVLEDLGQKRLLLVYGEHPTLDAKWIAHTMQVVYDTVSEKSGEIRRVNVNCAPLDVDGYRALKDTGIGTYQCFQETYHRKTYEKVHLSGRKTNYLWRLNSLHRAQKAGIDDVAMGALFGLYDYRFDMLGLLQHAEELEKMFGVGPHTISFPRLEPALGSEMSYNPPYPISLHDFKKVVAILRLAVPYTGLILTTRENAEFRSELIKVGVSQISAGSRTYPGAYTDPEYDRPDVQQFCVGDSRSLDEVIRDVVQQGYLPSWCTACYRLGRTGEHFMELAKKGFIQTYCHPNALMTFNEYLNDYASPETREAGRILLENEVAGMADEKRRDLVSERIKRIDSGERDLYF